MQRISVNLHLIYIDALLIYENKLPSFVGEKTMEFDLSKYKGQFIIQVFQGKEMVSSKIVIQ